VSFVNEWRGHQVHKRFAAQVTGSDFVRSVRAVCEDERFDRLDAVINDFSQVTSLDIDDSAMTDAAALTIGVSVTNPRLVVAFVIPEGEVGDQIRSILAPQVVPSFRHRVFATLDQAQSWIQESGRLVPR